MYLSKTQNSIFGVNVVLVQKLPPLLKCEEAYGKDQCYDVFFLLFGLLRNRVNNTNAVRETRPRYRTKIFAYKKRKSFSKMFQKPSEQPKNKL